MIKFLLLKKELLHKELVLLLVIGGLYTLGIFLSNTFVNVYLWRQSGEFLTIAIYNFAIILFQLITFVIAGKLIKKIDRIIVLRLGVSFLAVFFLTVLLLGEHAATFNFLLGSLLGIGYGFYILAFSVLTFEITEPDTRDLFNGFTGILESIAGMLGPLLAGIIIARLTESKGYMIIFAVSLGLFLLAIVGSFFLGRRSASYPYRLIQVFQELKVNKSWAAVNGANFFQGLREGLFMFVMTIIVYIHTENEFKLGVFNSSLYISSFVFYFLVMTFSEHLSRRRLLQIGSIVIAFAVFIFVFNVSYLYLIIYAIVVGIAYPILNVPFQSLTYDVIGKARDVEKLRVEYIVSIELFTNLGRLLSISLFIIGLFIFRTDLTVALSYLVIFSPAYLLIYFLLKDIVLFDKK